MVRTNCRHPLLDPEDLIVNMNLHVLLHCDLAGQAIAVCSFSLGDVRQLGRQNIAATLVDLNPALGTGAAAATGGGYEQIVVGEGRQQLGADRHMNGFFIVDQNLDIALGHQLRFGAQNDENQRYDNEGEKQNTQDDFQHSLLSSSLKVEYPRRP